MARHRAARLASLEHDPRKAKRIITKPASQAARTHADMQHAQPSPHRLDAGAIRNMQRTVGNQAVIRKLQQRRPPTHAIQRLITVAGNTYSPVQAIEHFHSSANFQVNDAAFPSGVAAPTRLAWDRARMIQEGGDITTRGKLKETFSREVTTYHVLLDVIGNYDKGVKQAQPTAELNSRLGTVLAWANTWLREHTKENKEQDRRAAIKKLVADVTAERQRLAALPTTQASTGIMDRLVELSNTNSNFASWQALFTDASTQAAAPANAGITIGGPPQAFTIGALTLQVQHPLNVTPGAADKSVYERIQISNVPADAFPDDDQPRGFEQSMVKNPAASKKVIDTHSHPSDMVADPPVAGEYKVFQTYAVGPKKNINRPPDDSGALVDFASYLITYRVYQGEDGKWRFLILKQGEGTQVGARWVKNNGNWALEEQF